MTIKHADSPESLKQALHRLIQRPGLAKVDVDHQVRALLRHAESRQLSLEHCLIAQDREEILACCLNIDSPGRTSAVYIPAHQPNERAVEAAIALLKHASELARQRHISFLQSIIPTDAVVDRQVLCKAGFQQLAELIYMENDLTTWQGGEKSPWQLTWINYSSETHDLFGKTVQATYEGTLDCAQLSGLRDISDILATHRATGIFDPRMWLLGLVDNEPVGVLLLSRLPEVSAVEVVYMGLRAEWRGRGLALALLNHGIRVAQEQAALRLTLAVDAVNKPARKLYARCGFREITRRCAWIHVLQPRPPHNISQETR